MIKLSPVRLRIRGVKRPTVSPRALADPPSLSKSIFPLFIFNRGLHRSSAANGRHSCQQNNTSCSTNRSSSICLSAPPPPPQLPRAMTPFLPKWKQEQGRQVGPMLFRCVSGLLTVYRKIPKRLENEAEVSLVSTSAVQ